MPLAGCGDANAAAQNLCQAVGGRGNAQRLGGASLFGRDGPSPHLGERRATFLRPHDLRFHRQPQTQAPLVAPRQPGFAHPQIVKTHIASKMAVARTPLHFSVSIHRQQVPTVIIASLHVPAIRVDLRSLHRPVRQIDTSPHDLRLAQPARVNLTADATSCKRFGDEATRRGQQDQGIANMIAKSLKKGHGFSLPVKRQCRSVRMQTAEQSYYQLQMRVNYFEFIGFRLARERLGRRGVKELPDLPDSLRFAQRNAFTLRVLRLTASPRGSPGAELQGRAIQTPASKA